MLILASSSPRRKNLLRRLKIPFEIRTAPVDELPSSADSWLTPAEFAWFNALRKARAVQCQIPTQPILGADTIVALNGRIFGKPRHLREAAQFLQLLGGKTHEVITAVALLTPDQKVYSVIDRSEVTFRPLSDRAIQTYLKKVPVLDKAGAYAIQEQRHLIIRRVKGSATNVAGFPVPQVRRLLIEAGLLSS